jgi:RNA polymerase sigma factor (sigma-70 family)
MLCAADQCMTSAQSHIEKHRAWARRVARSLWYPYRQSMDADDVLSAADEALCICASRYQSNRGVRFQTYAYRYIQGSVRRTIRREMHHRRRASTPVKHVASQQPSPESTTMVMNLLRGLARDQQALVWAHIVGHCPLAEIARRLRVSPSWASRRLKKALIQLRKHLASTERNPTCLP